MLQMETQPVGLQSPDILTSICDRATVKGGATHDGAGQQLSDKTLVPRLHPQADGAD